MAHMACGTQVPLRERFGGVGCGDFAYSAAVGWGLLECWKVGRCSRAGATHAAVPARATEATTAQLNQSGGRSGRRSHSACHTARYSAQAIRAPPFSPSDSALSVNPNPKP